MKSAERLGTRQLLPCQQGKPAECCIKVETRFGIFSKTLPKMAYDTSRSIPFVSVLRATGHGEVWDHTDDKKFSQFGWRCTNNESSYSPTRTLVGNWNEQRFDISTLAQAKPIPSQVKKNFIR